MRVAGMCLVALCTAGVAAAQESPAAKAELKDAGGRTVKSTSP